MSPGQKSNLSPRMVYIKPVIYLSDTIYMYLLASTCNLFLHYTFILAYTFILGTLLD